MVEGETVTTGGYSIVTANRLGFLTDLLEIVKNNIQSALRYIESEYFC